MRKRRAVTWSDVFLTCYAKLMLDAEDRMRMIARSIMHMMLWGYLLAVGMLMCGAIGKQDFRILRNASIYLPPVFGYAAAKHVMDAARMPAHGAMKKQARQLIRTIAETDAGSRKAFCRLGSAVLREDTAMIYAAIRDIEAVKDLEGPPFIALVKKAFPDPG